MKKALILLLMIMNASIVVFAGEYILFDKNGKVGLKNDQGTVLLQPTFEALGWSDGSFSLQGSITGFKLNGLWGLINLKQETIAKAEFESLLFSGADRVIARKKINAITSKTGSLTITGEITIPFQYDAIAIYGLRAVVMNKIGKEYLFGLVDLNNGSIIPLEYLNIYPVSFLRYAVENKQSKQALFSDDGKRVTDFFIDSISSFRKNYSMIYSRGFIGVLDRDGNIIAPPTFADIKFREDESIIALQPDSWKILDTRNQEINSLAVDNLKPFTNELYKVSTSGKYGLIDKNLQSVWAVQYDYISKPLNNFVVTKQQNKYGLLFMDGREKIPIQYDSLLWDGTVALGKLSVEGNLKWKLLNVNSGEQSKFYDSVAKISNQHFKVLKNGYYGIMNSSGIEKVHCVYDSIFELKGEQIAVQFKNLYGIISINEDWILGPQTAKFQLVNDDFYLETKGKIHFLKSFSGNIIYFTENNLTITESYLLEQTVSTVKKIGFNGIEIQDNLSTLYESPFPKTDMTKRSISNGVPTLFQRQGKFGFLDERGRLQIPNRYDSAKPFNNELAAFKLLGKWGYLNTSDKIIVNPTFEFAGDFINGFAIVSKNKKQGLIDREGTVKLTLSYDSIKRLNNKLTLQHNGKLGLAQADGKILIEPRYDELKLLSNNQVMVKLHNKYGVLSEDGLNIIPMTYHSLQFDEDKKVFLAHQQSQWITLLPKN